MRKNCYTGELRKLQLDNFPERLKERKGDNKRKLNLDDLFAMFSRCDELLIIDKLPMFVAANLSKVPWMKPEDLDMCVQAKRVSALEDQLSNQTGILSDLITRSQDRVGPSVESKVLANREPLLNPTEPVVTANTSDCAVYSSLLSGEDDGSWFNVQRKVKSVKVQQCRRILGTASTDNDEAKVRSAARKEKYWHIFAGRLHADTTPDDVTALLALNNITVHKISLMQRREKLQENYPAFHIAIDFASKDVVFTESIWPEGADIRDWIFTSSKSNSS